MFTPATEALLDAAGVACARRGARLTALRRQVLGLVLDSATPSGAYDLLERLRPHHQGAAPPTVYRALEFLQEHGLVHRVERLAAFVGCVGHAAPAHSAQFLICGRCGRADEIDDAGVADALAQAAARLGFTVSGATVEAEGLCAACRVSG